MRKIKRFFSRLQSKLTITYTLVTVFALLAVEILVIIGIVVVYLLTDTAKSSYLADVLYQNSSKASTYLESAEPDIDGLKNWLQEVLDSGYASLDPIDILDNPAAPIISGSSIYVLSLQQEILIKIPEESVHSKKIEASLPDVREKIESYAARQINGSIGYPLDLYIELDDSSYLVIVPVIDSKNEVVLSYLLINIAPPPPFPTAIVGYLITAILLTGLILLVVLTPFGALFGFIMARSLTKRIGNISQIVAQWRQDNFSQMPSDSSADEIGDLAKDLTKMAEDFQKMLQTQQELSRLEERNRLARELHDTVKQQVFATMMQLRAAKNSVSSDPNSAIQQLEEAEKLVKASQQELNLMINEMRPVDGQENQSLLTLLSEYLSGWQNQTGINSHISGEGCGEIDFPIRLNLLRIFQETLSNISKHSQADKVDVKLAIDSEILTLEIADNGVGFILDDSHQSQKGFGLESIQQRVKNIEGEIRINSQPNIGTTIRVSAPRSLEK